MPLVQGDRSRGKQLTESGAEVLASVYGKGAERETVEGMVEVDEAVPLRRGAGELQARFDSFGAGVGEEDGVEAGARPPGAFRQSLGQKPSHERAVHLNHVRPIKVDELVECLLQDWMATPELVNTVAPEEIQVAILVTIVEIGALAAGIRNVSMI